MNPTGEMLVLQLVDSLSDHQLVSIDHSYSSVPPTMKLGDLDPGQLQLARALLKHYGARVNEKSAVEFPPEDIFLRIRSQRLANLHWADKTLLMQMPITGVDDADLAARLGAARSKCKEYPHLPSRDLPWNLKELCDAFLTVTKPMEVSRLLEGTKFFFFFEEAPRDLIIAWASAGAKCEFRDFPKRVFVGPAESVFNEYFWTVYDRWCRIKKLNRVDPFDALRERRRLLRMRELTQEQVEELIRIYSSYQEVNKEWKKVASSEIRNRGEVEFGGEITVEFTFVLSERGQAPQAQAILSNSAITE